MLEWTRKLEGRLTGMKAHALALTDAALVDEVVERVNVLQTFQLVNVLATVVVPVVYWYGRFAGWWS